MARQICAGEGQEWPGIKGMNLVALEQIQKFYLDDLWSSNRSK